MSNTEPTLLPIRNEDLNTEYERILPNNPAEVENTARRKKATDTRTRDFEERFNEFMQNIKLSSNCCSDRLFGEILSSLIFKTQGILDQSSLGQAFNALLTKVVKNPRYGKTNWTEEETNYLISVTAHYCHSFSTDFHSLEDKDWYFLGQIFPTKLSWQLSKRWNSMLKVTVGQSPWTPQEDKFLNLLVAQHGSERQWKVIAEKINSRFGNGIFRHSRQCRERWINYIDPKINRGDWTQKDDLNLMKSFLKLGKKWSAIAKILGDRTENAVRNRWNSLVKRFLAESEALDRNLSYEKDKNYEIAIANKFVENATVDCFLSFSERGNQSLKEPRDLLGVEKITPDPTFSDKNVNKDSRSLIDKGDCYEKTDLQALHRKFQQSLINHPSQGIPDVGRLSLWVNSGNQHVRIRNPLYSEANNETTLISQDTTIQIHSGAYGHNATQKLSLQSFRVSNDPDTQQKFSREVAKTGSQVFYAIIDSSKNEIKLMEKVSETNWSKFLVSSFKDQSTLLSGCNSPNLQTFSELGDCVYGYLI